MTSIVPKGGVVETFDPSPRDVAAVSAADLIVMNGLGLDDWLQPVIDSAKPDVPVVRLAENLPGVDYVVRRAAARPPTPTSGSTCATPSNTSGGSPTPWPRRIRRTPRRSRPAATPTPPGSLRSTPRSAHQIATIPEANRKLVSFHEAFPYFAKAYGLDDRRLGRRGSRSGSVGRRGRRAHRRDQALRGEGRLRRSRVQPRPRRRRSPTRPASRSRPTSTTTRWAIRRSTRTRA